jgi:hypothetical protein
MLRQHNNFIRQRQRLHCHADLFTINRTAPRRGMSRRTTIIVDRHSPEPIGELPDRERRVRSYEDGIRTRYRVDGALVQYEMPRSRRERERVISERQHRLRDRERWREGPSVSETRTDDNLDSAIRYIERSRGPARLPAFIRQAEPRSPPPPPEPYIPSRHNQDRSSRSRATSFNSEPEPPTSSSPAFANIMAKPRSTASLSDCTMSDTISKDRRSGNDARHAEIFARMGRKAATPRYLDVEHDQSPPRRKVLERSPRRSLALAPDFDRSDYSSDDEEPIVHLRQPLFPKLNEVC